MGLFTVALKVALKAPYVKYSTCHKCWKTFSEYNHGWSLGIDNPKCNLTSPEIWILRPPPPPPKQGKRTPSVPSHELTPIPLPTHLQPHGTSTTTFQIWSQSKICINPNRHKVVDHGTSYDHVPKLVNQTLTYLSSDLEFIIYAILHIYLDCTVWLPPNYYDI